MAQCGKNIYVFFARMDLDLGTGQESRLSFQNSTDYFRELLVTRQGEDPGSLRTLDISAGLVPECKTPARFTSSNNAWTLLATSATNEAFPVLLSRSLDVSSLLTHMSTTPTQTPAPLFTPPAEGQPKWGKWAVVVVRGGAISMTENAKKKFPAILGTSFTKEQIPEQTFEYLTPDERQTVTP